MASDRNRNFLIRIARKYYLEGLSQQEIAQEMNISRASISNYLKRCREEGIVEIRIEENNDTLAQGLSERLKKTFGLQSVVVVPRRDSAALTLQEAGKAAAKLLDQVLHNGIRIGLSWGSTLFHVVDALPAHPVTKGEVVQLTGSLGMANPAFDGIELTQKLAGKINAEYRLLPSPVLVKKSELKSLLIAEPPIALTLSRMEALEFALVGISSDKPESSSMVREGFIKSDEADRIRSEGGIGHICGLHYNAGGQFLPIPENNLVVGISGPQLKAVPHVLGVACGIDKAEAILGALRGKLLNSLVTDEEAALKIAEKIQSAAAG